MFSPKAEIQRSINMYRQRVESDQGIGPFVPLKSPGMTPYITAFKDGPVRGCLSRDVAAKYHAFTVVDDTVYDHTNTTITDTYTPILTDGGPVYMAASPTTLMIVSNRRLYRINGGAMTEITPPVGRVLNVAFLKNYFVVLYVDLQQFGWSSNDGATFPAANVQTFEADANAVFTMIVKDEQLWLIGTRLSKAYYVGTNPNAPFVPNDGSTMMSGTRAPASLKQLGTSLLWLESNKEGQGRVVMTEGYNPQRVSNLAVENAIRGYSTTDDAIGMPYLQNGQEFYRITFPTADRTWEYNKTLSAITGISEWEEIRHYQWLTGTWARHRGMSIMSAFNRILVGDHTNGILYEMSPDIYHDFGFPLRWERRSPHILEGNKYIAYDRFELGIETGVGLTVPLWLNSYNMQRAAFVTALAAEVSGGTVTAAQSTVLQLIYDNLPYTPLDPYPSVATMNTLGFYPWGASQTLSDGTVIGSQPTIQMRYSSDGGKNFGAYISRSLGGAGTDRQVYWDRCGMARDRVFDLAGDDPVRYAITTAWLDVEELVA